MALVSRAQLKGFDAVRLEAGERRELSIDIASDDLMIFDEESGSRIMPTGEYEFAPASPPVTSGPPPPWSILKSPADEPM